VQPLDALGEPVRRRILEVIGVAEISAGAVAQALRSELGLSQPATSQHLKVLRDSGLVVVRSMGTSRLYRLDRDRLAEAAAWFDQFADPWQQPLDALETELARGKRERRQQAGDSSIGATAVDDVRPTGQVGQLGV
jgi:DNA-binding transcriptional ArsR family regulator